MVTAFGAEAQVSEHMVGGTSTVGAMAGVSVGGSLTEVRLRQPLPPRLGDSRTAVLRSGSPARSSSGSVCSPQPPVSQGGPGCP